LKPSSPCIYDKTWLHLLPWSRISECRGLSAHMSMRGANNGFQFSIIGIYPLFNAFSWFTTEPAMSSVTTLLEQERRWMLESFQLSFCGRPASDNYQESNLFHVWLLLPLVSSEKRISGATTSGRLPALLIRGMWSCVLGVLLQQ